MKMFEVISFLEDVAVVDGVSSGPVAKPALKAGVESTEDVGRVVPTRLFKTLRRKNLRLKKKLI